MCLCLCVSVYLCGSVSVCVCVCLCMCLCVSESVYEDIRDQGITTYAGTLLAPLHQSFKESISVCPPDKSVRAISSYDSSVHDLLMENVYKYVVNATAWRQQAGEKMR